MASARSGDRRAVFAEQAARNATLAEVFQTYWDMIRSLQDITILNEQKMVLDQRRARVTRLLNSGTFTNYELGQIDSELASFVLREEARMDPISAAVQFAPHSDGGRYRQRPGAERCGSSAGGRRAGAAVRCL